ncbi:MAG TPA: DegQ family serine endoprotease [Steroidobacteraceae bacterium]|nr:DegQ family serine endoprotease [Steroidobacteraceae bacterium]
MNSNPLTALRLLTLLSIAAVAAAQPQWAHAATSPPPLAVSETPLPSLSPMLKRIAPAVVNVATRGTVKERGPQNPLLDDPFFRRFFDTPPSSGTRERPFQSAGSGVIFDARNGYILTNAHVVENASEITVTLQDGRDLAADVLGSDEPSDVAVLKVKPANLTQITLGDSSKVEVGDFVVAIGNPFGLHNTVSHGIVSGLGRSNINTDGYEDFIQTDASINPGNSGGALVNLRGELIGINTAILSRTGGNIGIGFAIPVNMARSITDQLVKFGSVKRGLLGVSTYTVSADIAQVYGLANAQGALVTQVVAGSAAEKAGIRTGDIITGVNGVSVKTPTELRNTVGMLRVGDKVDLELLRDGKPQRVMAVISAPPATTTASTAAKPADIHQGLEGASFTDAPDAGGAVVRSVDPGSPAAQAGLRASDIIVGVNQSKVGSVQQLKERAQSTPTLVLEVRRGNAIVLVPVH